MIAPGADRGTVKVDEQVELSPDDEILVIEAYDKADRRRAHELMADNWSLIALARRRTPDGQHYTEYVLLPPRG